MIADKVLKHLHTIRFLALFGLMLFLTATTVAQTSTSPAAQAKNVSVVLRGLDVAYQANVKGMLELWAFDGKKIPSLARLRYLHREAPQQIKSALRPFGYYRAKVEADLSDLGGQWQAVYQITPGDRIKVTSEPTIALSGVVVDCDDFRYQPYNRKSLMPDIKVDDDQFNKHKDLVTAFCAARDKADLKKGEPLDQQAYEALKQTLQSTASRFGYFDAEFTRHEIRIDVKAYTADVVLEMNPGERYRISEAKLTQDSEWISSSLLDRYVELEDQDYFDAGALQSLQSDLTNSEYYKQVEVKAAVQDARDLEIPVQVNLTPIIPREYVFGIGYGTDTGVRSKLGITGRRVNSRGHQYLVEGRISQIGYGLAAEYKIPTGDPRTDSYGINMRLERDTEKGDSQAYSLGGNYQFRDGLWFKRYALDLQVSEFEEDDETSTTTLLMPGLEWTRTAPAELEKRINTINGSWFQFGLRGASESMLSDTSFVQPRLSFKRISSFENKHRIIVKASAATTWVDDFDKLPLTLRYYTGGDSSVRGYPFEEIAPIDVDGEPRGGKHLLEAGIEYEVPFKESYSWVVFGDVGDAFDDRPDIKAGVGLGLRWRSPIGPIRFDVARSLDDPGKGKVRVHLSLGPDL